MSSSNTPNRLINATSPYLLQHALNPVDWFEWSEEALQKARSEDKPILVSIGYSACHWCHVMERESFENEDIADIMNEYFVCIKVDREERPDIDHVYMEAVQAMGMNGGWPLNVFLTPSQQPFYGGTYFPPQSWAKLLRQVQQTFQLKRNEINQSADELTKHLATSDLQRFAKTEGDFSKDDFIKIVNQLASKFDSTWGGLDKAPKFVMPTIWMWLLRYHTLSKDKQSLEMVLLTLKQMAYGGLYDQLGGGFARYSVDREWFAPHFEKMLYDNAQLLSLYSEAYRISLDPEFKHVVYETTHWLVHEMTHQEGGFYSALDADSEGVEGKFYTWTQQELSELLGDKAPVFSEYYQVTANGNWEHGRNILHRSLTSENKIDANILTFCKQQLMLERGKGIRPGLDDKILTGWNAMTITGLVDAYHAFHDSWFLDLALQNIRFLEKKLIDEHRCYRTFKDKRNSTEGFLEDYAFLINSYISLYQATFDEGWIQKAHRWSAYVLENFWDNQEGYFFFSGKGAEKLIANKKEIFDNVIPASNSVMARNLFLLGTLSDNDDFREKAQRMATSLKNLIVSEPSYNSNWAMLAMDIHMPFAEIAIVGKDALSIKNEMIQQSIPPAVFMGSVGSSNLPLLKDKPATDVTTIYVCYNKTCQLPVTSVAEALKLLRYP